MTHDDTDPEILATEVARALTTAAADIEPRPDAYALLVARVETASGRRRRWGWGLGPPSRLAFGAVLGAVSVAAVAVAVATPLVDLGREVESVAGRGGAANVVGSLTLPVTSTGDARESSTTSSPPDAAADELARLVFDLLAVAADPDLAGDFLPLDDGTTAVVIAGEHRIDLPASSLLTPAGWRQPLALPPPGGHTKGTTGAGGGPGPSLVDLLAVPAPKQVGAPPEQLTAFTTGSDMEGFTPVPLLEVYSRYQGADGLAREVRFGFDTEPDGYRLASIEIQLTP